MGSVLYYMIAHIYYVAMLDTITLPYHGKSVLLC